MATLEDVCEELKRQWGLEFDRVRAVVHALGSGATVAQLVAHCGISQRAVAGILDHLLPFLCRDGDHFRLSSTARQAAATLFAAPLVHTDPWEELALRHPALPLLAADLEQRPSPSRHLDQVAATPTTAIKRALFLSRRFDLAGAKVLFIGDYDMTALALAHVEPEADLAVVDVDERLLSLVDELRRQRRWHLEIHFADLRLELPRCLGGRFDLVFTDPPYTESGVKLFLQRSIQALNQHPFSRIACAYGVGERQVGLELKVQTVINNLRLVSEAIEPGFNHYEHAPALGNRSDLYLLRPTRRSSAAAGRLTWSGDIYTRGRQAEEASTMPIPPSLIDRLSRFAAGSSHSLAVAPEGKQLAAIAVTERLSVAAYLMSNNLRRCRQAVVTNLYPHHGDYLTRLCLCSQASDLAVCAPQRAVADLFAHENPLRMLVESRFELVERCQEGNVGAAFLRRRPPGGLDDVARVLNGIFSRPRARLVNAWRQSLIAWSRTRGRVLTKNEARRAVAESTFTAFHAGNDAADLPAVALGRLAAAVADSIATVGTNRSSASEVTAAEGEESGDSGQAQGQGPGPG